MNPAYTLFGGSPADVITDAAGNVLPGRAISVWTAFTGGVQVTDLLALDDTALPGLVEADAYGRYLFQARKTYAVLWAWDGDDDHPRWPLPAWAQLADVAAAKALAAAAASDAAAALAAAQTGGAGALRQAIYVVTDAAYGAKGDGVTLDHAAIQACLDACHAAGGGTVILPGGRTYMLGATLALPARTLVLAHGAVVRANSAGLPLAYNYSAAEIGGTAPGGAITGYGGRAGCHIDGGTWDMRGHVNTTADAHNAFTFAHCRGGSFRNASVRNVRGYHGIEPHSTRGFVIDNVRFEGYVDNLPAGSTPREAIQLDSVGQPWDDDTPNRDLTIRNVYVGPSPIAGEAGAWKRGIGSHTVGAANRHRGTRIDRVTGEGVVDVVRPYSWLDTTITNVVGIGITGYGVLAECADGANGSRLTVDDVKLDAGVAAVQVNSSPAGTGTWSLVHVDRPIAANLTAVFGVDVAANNSVVRNPRLDQCAGGVRLLGSNNEILGGQLTTIAGEGAVLEGSTASGFGGLIDDVTMSSVSGYNVRLKNLSGARVGSATINNPGTHVVRCDTACTDTLISGVKARNLASTARKLLSLAASATGIDYDGNSCAGSGHTASTWMDFTAGATYRTTLGEALRTTAPTVVGHNTIT